jgi:hypothetical protein
MHKWAGQIKPEEIDEKIGKDLQVPFDFMLENDLPSSFWYSGENMSTAKVIYKINA